MDNDITLAVAKLFVLAPSDGQDGKISFLPGEITEPGEIFEFDVFGTVVLDGPHSLERLAITATELLILSRALGVELQTQIEFSGSVPVLRITEGQDELYAVLRIFEGLTEDELERTIRPESFEILNLSVLRYRADAMLTRGVVLGRSGFGL